MPSPFTLGTRAKSPVVSTVSRNPALACYRGPEAEDSRRPRPWARGCRFPTVGPRLRIAVALYRGHEGEVSRRLYREQESRARLLPWARGRRFPSPFTVGPRLKIPDRGPEAEDCGCPLPWARGGRSPSSSTVGPRPKIPVALYRGHEADGSRPLYCGREARDSRAPRCSPRMSVSSLNLN